MADLKNELMWSHTRQKRWETCPRLYYLAHYAHWGGWKRDADEKTRLCYILTKMMNLPMFMGDIVHGIVESILRDHREGQGRPIPEWVEEARMRLNSGWFQSRDRAWERDPKRNVNLFEHHYGLPMRHERTRAVSDRAARCIENFFTSGAWNVIQRVNPRQWLSLEELVSMPIGRFGMWIKIDFALEDEKGDCHIFDWKTGREDPSHRDQLMGYALYANRAWGIRPEMIRLVPVYLSEGQSEVIQVTKADLATAEKKIIAACEEWAAACDDPEKNTATEANFPMTDNRRECTNCFFQAVCYQPSEWPINAVKRL